MTQVCWFCKKEYEGGTDILVKLHKEVKHSGAGTKSGRREYSSTSGPTRHVVTQLINWESKEIQIPRCQSCFSKHKHTLSRGVLLGSVVGLIVGIVFVWLISLAPNDFGVWGSIACTTGLVLCFAVMFWGITTVRSESEKAKTAYPEIKDALGSGWEPGEIPWGVKRNMLP
jgi:hypothetical protein